MPARAMKNSERGTHVKTQKRTGGPVTLAALGLVFAITACLTWYYDVYVYWKPAQYTISVAVLIALFAALSFLAARKAWKAAVLSLAFLAAIFAPAVIINNVLGRGAPLAGAVSVILSGACVLVLCVLLIWQLNSLFADPKNGDYRLKENSPVLKRLPGFEGMPLEKIGRGKQPVS